MLQIGAGCFGLVIGWFLYFVNRHRKEEVKLADVATLLAAIGGGAVLSLFEAKSTLFAAYGVGLALGFFAYFFTLLILVGVSKDFTWDWFLDGRKKAPAPGVIVDPGERPMVDQGAQPKVR